MTEKEFIKSVAVNIGVLTDNEDILHQIGTRAKGVMEFMNGGGADITLENITDHELLCIALGTSDMLNQIDAKYSEGFLSMAAQIQLRGKKTVKDENK